jgi:hypothetical protein
VGALCELLFCSVSSVYNLHMYLIIRLIITNIAYEKGNGSTACCVVLDDDCFLRKFVHYSVREILRPLHELL